MKYYIYVAQAEADIPLFKVGITKNVRQRLTQLQTGCPFVLVPYRLFTCASLSIAREVEKFIHSKLSSHKQRRKGEWYKAKRAWVDVVMFEVLNRHNILYEWRLEEVHIAEN